MVRRLHADAQIKKVRRASKDGPTEDEYRAMIPIVERVTRYNITLAAGIDAAVKKLHYRRESWVRKWVTHMRTYGWPARLKSASALG
jgi:hypothetical protein